MLDNPALTSLTAFTLLNHIGGNFVLNGNLALESLSGLDGIERVESDLSIFQNRALTEIDGFHGLDRVGRLSIVGNENLTLISGFNTLATVDDDVELTNNRALEVITGFQQLSSVGDDVFMDGNTRLRSITEAFSALSFTGAQGTFDRLYIRHNDSLCESEVNAFIERVDIPLGRTATVNNRGVTDACGVCGGDARDALECSDDDE